MCEKQTEIHRVREPDPLNKIIWLIEKVYVWFKRIWHIYISHKCAKNK